MKKIISRTNHDARSTTPYNDDLALTQKISRNLAALTSRWEELELTLDAFNERIEDQMSHLRGQMAGRVSELQGGVQKFSARWFELKPKRLDTGQREEMDAVISRVKEWQQEFAELDSLTAIGSPADVPKTKVPTAPKEEADAAVRVDDLMAQIAMLDSLVSPEK